MDTAKPGLLLVDDDPLIRDTLSFVLADDFDIRSAANRPEAVAWASSVEFRPALALVDLGLPPNPHQPDEGFRLIVELAALVPTIKTLALTGQTSEHNARHARTLGAIDFIAKPVSAAALREILKRALNWREVDADIAPQLDVAGLVGHSPAMERLKRQVHQFAGSPFPVLITGESGSGKEAVAKALHAASPRARQPFLALNCAALTESLIEATLFGHAKGAFTGAIAAKSGYFDEVGEGTLFLDEIGELPLGLQAKLLRVLENGEFQRLGETQTRTSRARVVAATNRDLRRLARSGEFRADLYHRLSVLALETPPLRDLHEDRRVLLAHFLQLYARQLGVTPFHFDDTAWQRWDNYPFPGNVRELRNIIIRLLAKYPGAGIDATLLVDEFDSDLLPATSRFEQADLEAATRLLRESRDFNLDQWLASWEKNCIEAALAMADGHMSQAARLLGVNRTTLYSRLDSLHDRHRKER
ncbi:sigma-54-dependent Fis family transcriptional regulator [Chitinimonas arctica]|uniref:Sigma-54-dependent Fis family transcriptional regulator n=1 Tax=Chitinimonas arctica TaxID=2594795 RepID=A0A516SEB2_9NEIS|nr:sigma-54 dependent transcriptional regulator [Chitinimonas arctica]QDQ26507.1 sigma-54-dependent Fis family transcriptional regulator [Chitinimonas arctica]